MFPLRLNNVLSWDARVPTFEIPRGSLAQVHAWGGKGGEQGFAVLSGQA
ncbi:MAG: hypothetical protein HQL97_09485 [Magnetococcales bacterium]|nr:hypothetical protein [Magnetococcales bacterium]